MKTHIRILSTVLIGLLATAVLAGSGNAPLTKKQVAEYIDARIASHRLQMKMKANADRYDNVIQAFYRKRETMLAERGFTVEEYENRQRRISAVISAMREAEEMERDAPELAERKKKIRENPHFTEEQKRQLIATEEKLHSYATPLIEETKPDWPAVEPYRDALERLTDWVAGTVDEPPEI